MIGPVTVSYDYNGKDYTSGTVVQADDGCNTCICQKNIRCTDYPCLKGKNHANPVCVKSCHLSCLRRDLKCQFSWLNDTNYVKKFET